MIAVAAWVRLKLRKDHGQCPCCGGRKRISYDIFTDEVTCWKCGLVGSVAEFRSQTVAK